MKTKTTHSAASNEMQFRIAFRECIFILVFLFGIQNCFAQKTWTGTTSTDWNTGSNWNPSGVPTSAHDVTIPNVTNDPRIDGTFSVKSITVNNGGVLLFQRGTTNSLTVTNNVDVNAGGTFNVRTGGGSGTSTLNIGGNLTNAGTMDFIDNSVANIVFNSTNQSINGIGTYSLNNISTTGTGTLTLNTGAVGMESFSLSSGKTFAIGANNIWLGGSWTNAGGTVTGTTGIIIFDGTGTIGGAASTTFTNLAIQGTVTQAINTTTSGNFIQNSGTYTVSTSGNRNLTVGGNFSLSGGEFIMIGNSSSTGATVSVSGTTTLSSTGKLNMESAGATNGVAVFNALGDFTSTGTSVASAGSDGVIDFGTGTVTNNAINISGNFTKSGVGTFGTTSTGAALGFVFNKAGTQTYSNTGANSDYVNYVVASSSTLQLLTSLTLSALSSPVSSLTINGTLDVSPAGIVNGGATNGIFTLSSGATLKTSVTAGIFSGVSGSVSSSVANRNFNAGANYVFTGSAQTANFPNTNINSLTVANSGGTLTLNAAIAAAGNVTINSGSSLTSGTFTHTVAGNWINDGGTFVPGSGTISLNGAAQTVGGTSSSVNFNNLSLSGGTKSFVKPLAVSTTLSITATGVANFGTLTTHTSGRLNLGGLGTTAAKFGSTSTSATPTVYKNDTYFTSGTTGYITVNTGTCTAPTISFGTIPAVCPGVTSVSLPYTATTGSADLYSIAGSGITTVTNGALAAAPSSIVIGLSSPAVAGTITSSSFNVSSSLTGCISNNINGSVIVNPNIAAPSFSAGPSTVCQDAADTTYTAAATGATISYSVLPAGAGSINTSSGLMNWNASFSGTATITATATGCGGPTTADRAVTVTPTVGTPSFTTGATALCQNAADETYAATANNSTGITYSVSPSGAGTIDSVTGVMNWNASFSGTATITASAAGCGGPKTATRNVVVTATVGNPSFTAGDTSVCQDASNETYTATATNNTGITYSVLPVEAGVINSATGSMNWSSTFSGTATITATVTGCNGPKTVNRVVTVTPFVGTPVFTAGSLVECQDAPNETYSASAPDSSSMFYSVSPSGAGSIGFFSGVMNWNASFTGTATITATASGCGGFESTGIQVTVIPTVGNPSFTTGALTVCQDAPDSIYTATATNSTITYSVLPIEAGTIDSTTGTMDWNPAFNGIATITATAAGCNGPKTVTRFVTVTPTVGVPSFTAGPITVCQDAADTTYTATASNNTGITYSVLPASAGTIGTTTGIMDWNAGFSGLATITASATGCNGPETSDIIVTVNALPIVTASDVNGCSGSSIALSGSGLPEGGSGIYSVANPYIGTSSTTYTFTYTDTNGCSATSDPAAITITPQPLWYLDADGDGYYMGLPIPSCTSLGEGYTTASLLGDGDCADGNASINPGETEICYNGIDENCNIALSDGCVPVIVNMATSHDNSTLPSLSVAVPAVAYVYPGATNIKYRFSITNTVTGVTAPDVIQSSRYVTIPSSIHLYNASYTIKASAVINDEIVPFAGNTITVHSPSVQLISLNSGSCGATLPALASTITAHAGLNALSYTFRIRLNDSNPVPLYGYSQSTTRFVGANSFTGFPLQYATSYKIAVQYTFNDPVTNLPVESGYGAECTVNTPAMPVIALASPTCGAQVATMNANVNASPAPYATSYQLRVRLFTDNGSSPTYYYSTPSTSRFSSLANIQGVTLAYNTEYSISVRYSILNGSTTTWSAYGPECKVKTPFFPVTSLVPSQCGQPTATPLNQQLNITPYPGFPRYKVMLEEINGEDVIDFEEIEVNYSHFRLSDFSIAQPGKTYNVSVAIRLNGVYGNYDTACDLFTPSLSKAEMTVPFKAAVYPNPFADNFKLDIKTSSQSIVNVKVYDMIGRIIEQRDVRISDLENSALGNSYPSGVYNVVVSQEGATQTVRIVKR
ncbi:T9SS type A sorting domain-containing protein [Flavobacterium sp.]